jgi:hypothetical protein
MRTRLSILVALFAILSFSLAQRIVIEPQGIVINPLPDPSFTIEVFLDRDPTGEGRPTYTIGDSVQIGVTTNQPAYVYLYDVKPTGEITQILPNRFDEFGRNNFLQAGETKFFPPQGARYTFAIDPPNGLSKVIAVASRQPLNTDPLATYQGGDTLATSSIGESGFAEAFGIVVRPIPQQEWVTDTALYYVGSRPSVPAFGTLRLDSSPRGAEVFVDGAFAGYTPVDFDTRPGRHNIEFRLDGYVEEARSVNLNPGETATISATLTAARRSGTATFRSDPNNATVFVDGVRLGTAPLNRVELDVGSHQVRFSLDGHSDTVFNFNVSLNQNTRVDGSLRALSGSLIVQANVGGAQVFVNGNAAGTIPNGTGRLTLSNLPAGVHQLTVVAPGFNTVVTDFRIEAGATSQVRIQQNAR